MNCILGFFPKTAVVFRQEKKEDIMRKRKIKTKCIKVSLSKCNGVVKAYDDVQMAYAKQLENTPTISSFMCNVPIEDQLYGDMTTDFVIIDSNNKTIIRECCYRNQLLRPRMIKLLDFSQRYWRNKGVTDWKVVVEENAHEKE